MIANNLRFTTVKLTLVNKSPVCNRDTSVNFDAICLNNLLAGFLCIAPYEIWIDEQEMAIIWVPRHLYVYLILYLCLWMGDYWLLAAL